MEESKATEEEVKADENPPEEAPKETEEEVKSENETAKEDENKEETERGTSQPESSVAESSEMESSSSYIHEEVLTGSSTVFEEVVLEGSSANNLALDSSENVDADNKEATENEPKTEDDEAKPEGDNEEVIEEEVIVDDEGNEIFEEVVEEEGGEEDGVKGSGSDDEPYYDSSDDDIPLMDSDDEREAAAKAAEQAATAEDGSDNIDPSERSATHEVPQASDNFVPPTPAAKEWEKSFDVAPTSQSLNFRDIENQKVPYAPIPAQGTRERKPVPKASNRVYLLFAVVCCLLIAGGGAAIAIILLLDLNETDDDDNTKAMPTPAPSMRPPTPGNEVVTTMSPILRDCNFFGVTQPHVVDQCACDGEIAIIVDDVRARYEFLRQTFIPTVSTELHASISTEFFFILC